MSLSILALALLLHGASPPEHLDPPRVHLLSPRGGWTRQRLTTVQGTVSDHKVTVARLAAGGLELPVNVHAGRFEVKLLLPPGEVTLEVSARNAAGVGRDAVTLFAGVKAPDVVVLLTWDTAGTDLDLHVIDPAPITSYTRADK